MLREHVEPALLRADRSSWNWEWAPPASSHCKQQGKVFCSKMLSPGAPPMCPQAENIVILPKWTCGDKGQEKTHKHTPGLPDSLKSPICLLPFLQLPPWKRIIVFKSGNTLCSKAMGCPLPMHTGSTVWWEQGWTLLLLCFWMKRCRLAGKHALPCFASCYGSMLPHSSDTISPFQWCLWLLDLPCSAPHEYEAPVI